MAVKKRLKKLEIKKKHERRDQNLKQASLLFLVTHRLKWNTQHACKSLIEFMIVNDTVLLTLNLGGLRIRLHTQWNELDRSHLKLNRIHQLTANRMYLV